MESMTGFGESSFTLENVRFFFRIRSLNNKFLEIECKIPDSLGWLNPIIESHIRNKFKRGKIEILLEADKSLPVEYLMSSSVISSYEKLFQGYYSKKKFQLSPEIIANLPGLIEQKTKDWRSARSKFEFYFLRAMLKLQRARISEGKRIGLWSLRTIQKLTRLNRKVKQLNIQSVKKRAISTKRKLFDVMTSEKSPATGGEIALWMKLWKEKKEEILFYLNADTSEELNRVQSHCTKLAQMFGGKEAAGREVEFYLQELLREVNTLVAKSDEIEIIQTGIVMKTEIEKLREQARNLA